MSLFSSVHSFEAIVEHFRYMSGYSKYLGGNASEYLQSLFYLENMYLPGFGFYLSDHSEKVINRIIKNDGHCPCQPEITKETVCPCIKFEKNRDCCCNLWITD